MPTVGSGLTISGFTTEGAPLYPPGYYANSAARLAAGQNHSPQYPYYQKGLGPLRIKELSQCFLSDGTTPAVNKGSWGTLEAHWIVEGISSPGFNAFITRLTPTSATVQVGAAMPQVVEKYFVRLTPKGEPTITAFSPNPAPVGATVTLTGTNFHQGMDVLVNGTAATAVTVASITSATFVVPAGATTGLIQVVCRYGSTTSATNLSVGTQLPYPANLAQTAATTSSVMMGWGAVANSTGYRLRRNGSTVLMPGTATTYTDSGLVAGSQPQYEVQAIAAAGYTDSNWSPVVAAQVAASTGPTISSFSPTSGPAGTVINVSGSGFIPAPIIDSFSPTTGPVSTTVTVTGTNF